MLPDKKNSLKVKLGLAGKNRKPGLKEKLVLVARVAERPKAKKPVKRSKLETKKRKK